MTHIQTNKSVAYIMHINLRTWAYPVLYTLTVLLSSANVSHV